MEDPATIAMQHSSAAIVRCGRHTIAAASWQSAGLGALSLGATIDTLLQAGRCSYNIPLYSRHSSRLPTKHGSFKSMNALLLSRRVAYDA